MKRKILHIQDSNIAGYAWSHSFWLSKSSDGSLTLTARQSARGDSRLPIEPVQGLTTGVDVYRALGDMLAEAGYDLSEAIETAAVAEEIERLDATVAAEFLDAPEIIEAQDKAERLAAEKHERELLEPFAADIEAYVVRFSDEKLHYPGAGKVYPSIRSWMRRFMRQYVLAHGALPVGRHEIRVAGYSGGPHDFPDRNDE